MNTCQYKDFGLGLDAFDDDRTPTAASCNTAKSFAYPETSTGQELLDFGISSPDRRSLSSFSEGSSVFASEFAELSTVSEYPCLSTEFSSTYEPAPLAHEATPRFSQHKFETSRHRFVAESSPRHSYRASPYVVDRSRSRSSSTSSFVLSRTQRSSPFVHSDASDFSFQDLDFSSQGTSPSIMSSSIPNIDSNCINMPLFCSEAHFKQSSFFPPRSCQDNDCQPRASSATSSSGIFNVLHSNSQVEQQYDDCIPDLPGPPDLFGALQEDQILPPDEDMRPSDPDLMPREQELRFEGDLYTPRFVRGHGNKREGWCGICKPGRWLVLKNSGYWYDKSFTHGVSAATGMAFDGPTESRRMDRHPGVWEGLCNSCGEWIALISSKKKGTTWFRHAYKVDLHFFEYFENSTDYPGSVIPIKSLRMRPRNAEKPLILGQRDLQRWQNRQGALAGVL